MMKYKVVETANWSQNNCLTCSKADVKREDLHCSKKSLKITALHVVRRMTSQ